MELEVDRLHVGDNLDILRRYGATESVDLVYLDPPFKSNRAYHLIFRDESGRTSDAQQLAFDDSWHWGPTAETHYRSLVVPPEGSTSPGKLSITIASMVEAIGRNELTAYLVEMAVRLVELHRVLKPTGSLYLHCDPTASHYLKIVLDAVFGADKFVNEIVWKRQTSHNDAAQGAKHFGRLHDVLLFYAKGSRYVWSQPYRAYDEDYLEKFYRHVEPETGRRYTLSDITAPGGASPQKRNPFYEFLGVKRYWRFSEERMAYLYDQGRIVQARPGAVPRQKRYLDEMAGMPVGSWWDDIRPVQAQGAERIGYPTQKPLALLERIIEASSEPGDVVLDPFCGCGTAIEAAIRLNRRWIGIDVSDQAHRVINERFLKLYRHEVPTGVIAPKDVATARKLAVRRPHGRKEFERWAINMIGGQPNPGRDRGVDGVIPFVGKRGRVQQALVSVKSGKVKPGDMRDLKGAVNRERAAVGVLLTLAGASDEMRLEATTAGEYEEGIPKLQILTIADALTGVRPTLPKYRPQEMFSDIAAVEPVDTVAERIAELEDQIADARRQRRRREHERLERIRESVIRVLEAAEGQDESPASERDLAPRPEERAARRRP